MFLFYMFASVFPKRIYFHFQAWHIMTNNARHHYLATRFFYKQRFFSTQPQCCLTFSWIELQMLLRCCLIHISIIILRRFIYLLYLCPCLHLGLFMPYLRESIFIFVFIFIMINCIISWIQTCLSFCLFFRIWLLIIRW